MKRKFFIGLAILAVALVSFLLYETMIVSKRSPSKTTTYNDQGLELKVVYCQPSKRGRLIFGEEKDGALQPYGKYWRLGANAATEVTFSRNITFAGQPVNAGSYRMYAVPGTDSFQIFLNSELGVVYSAASEPDHSLDVQQVNIPVQTTDSSTEMFTIKFSSDSATIKMDLVWDKTLVSIPITVQ
jgi:hypothetical protein